VNDNQKLALLSLAHLNTVLIEQKQAPLDNKKAALAEVRWLIEAGVVSMDNVLNVKPQTVITGGVDNDLRDLLNDSNAKALDAVRASSVALQEVRNLNTQAANEFGKYRSEFKALADSLVSRVDAISKPDTARITNEITQQVSALFDQFREQATPQQLKTVANAVPTHLHQSLIALDDPLPDNVWLAGERGTGKSEFVTQVAARLKRRLYRINFDEALERADFIGGNSIESGSVVWKAGIVAQAIQHCGAIVLLDEIGFARAQSLAALHALCERSPHRSITISETGEDRQPHRRDARRSANHRVVRECGA